MTEWWCQGYTLLLEAADWAIADQQVKHHHDDMMLISIRVTSGFVIKTLVDLHWMPNDLHRAFKWGIVAALQLSQHVHNVDNKPGLIIKSAVLQIMFNIWLMHTWLSYVSSLLLAAPMYPWEQLPLGSTTGN